MLTGWAGTLQGWRAGLQPVRETEAMFITKKHIATRCCVAE
jgi:hypothetical protein